MVTAESVEFQLVTGKLIRECVETSLLNLSSITAIHKVSKKLFESKYTGKLKI